MSDNIDRPSVPNCLVSTRIGDVSGVSVMESLESFCFYGCELSPVVFRSNYDGNIIPTRSHIWRESRWVLLIGVDTEMWSSAKLSYHKFSLMFLEIISWTRSCVCRCDWICFSCWMDIRQAHGSLRYFFEKRISEVFLIERLPSFIIHWYILKYVAEEYSLVLWLWNMYGLIFSFLIQFTKPI